MRGKGLFVLTATSTLIALMPFMLHGGPFLEDAWEHMSMARLYAKEGVMIWGPDVDLSSKWPLANLLIYILMTIPGIPILQASQAIPFLAGLSIMPFYLALTRLYGRRSIALFCSLALAVESFHVTMVSSVAKVASTFYPLMCSILILTMLVGRPSLSHLVLFLLMSTGVLFGHHYTSLFFSLLLTLASAYMLIGWLEGEIDGKTALMVSVSAASFATCFITYATALRAWQGFIQLNDVLLLLSCVVVSSLALLTKTKSMRFSVLFVLAPLVGIMILKGEVYAMYFLPTNIHLHDVLGYALITLLTIIGGPLIERSSREAMFVRAYMASGLAMLLFSFTIGFVYLGVVLLLKAMYIMMPAVFAWLGLSLRRAKRKLFIAMTFAIAVSSILMAISGIRCAWLQDPGVGGLVAYDRGQYEELKLLAPYLMGDSLAADTPIQYLALMFDGLKVRGVSPYTRLSAGDKLVVLRRSWEAGLLEGGYEWFSIDAVISHPYDQVFSGGHL
ncbi:MAG: hypothetical protein DRJ56_08370, partial [Thermoprotei archaeon]